MALFRHIVPCAFLGDRAPDAGHGIILTAAGLGLGLAQPPQLNGDDLPLHVLTNGGRDIPGVFRRQPCFNLLGRRIARRVRSETT
jgi:hypothetical protein